MWGFRGPPRHKRSTRLSRESLILIMEGIGAVEAFFGLACYPPLMSTSPFSIFSSTETRCLDMISIYIYLFSFSIILNQAE